MAPEQVLGEPADTRSDIFSFGVVLFELLTGEHPFKKGTVSETMAAILRDPPSQVDDSGGRVDYAIFDKLLAKTPNDRYQSFEDVSVEVRRLRDVSSTWTEPVSAATDDGEPTVGGRRTPFVGRDAEQAELGRWLDRAVRGRGGLVLIGGEPGVGKTRLVEQVLETARQQRCLTLTGRCYEMEGTAPFIPFVEIIEQYTRVAPSEVLRETLGDAAPEVARLVPDLRRVFPDIPPPLELPPEQQRHYLFKNVAEFLERMSRVSSTVLLLDDLQWADNATLLLLQHLAPLLGQVPVLALGTYRDVELDVNRPFAKTLETLNRKRLAQRLNLQRLPTEAVAGMLAALGGSSPPEALVAGIYRETEGNPFFVEEVYQHLEDERVLHRDDGSWRPELDLANLDVPEGVRLVIGRRLERVSADSRKVLTFGAVVGRGFSLELLEAVGDVTGDALLTALEEAEATYLIMPMPGREPRWEFSHALIRQTLAAGLSLPRRQRLHLKVAEAIERAAGGNAEQHATDLAHHLFQAGTAADPDKTVRFLTLAGDQAQSAGAFDEALRHFDNALSIQEEDDPRHVADLRYKKGQALRSLGQGDPAVAAWLDAITIYEELDDGEAVARTVNDAASALIWLGDIATAQLLVRRGLGSLGAGLEVDRCRLLATLGLVASWSGDEHRVSHDAVDEADAIANRLGRPDLMGSVLRSRTWQHFCYMRFPETVEVGRVAAEQLRALGRLHEVCDVSGPTELGLVYRGRFDEALEVGTQLEDLAVRLGQMEGRYMALFCRTFHHLVTTESHATSEASALRGVEFAETTDLARGVSHFQLGLARFFLGDWTTARADFRDADRLVPAASWWGRWMPSVLLLAQAYAGEHDAVEPLRACRSGVLAIGDDSPMGTWQTIPNVVEGLATLGQISLAADCYGSVRKALDRGTMIAIGLQLWEMIAGIAAGAGEQWDVAQPHFETAMRQAHGVPHRTAQPEVRRWYAQMLLDRNGSGDSDKARTLLGEAVEMYQTIGMPRHLEMAKELLKSAL